MNRVHVFVLLFESACLGVHTLVMIRSGAIACFTVLWRGHPVSAASWIAYQDFVDTRLPDKFDMHQARQRRARSKGALPTSAG